MAAPSFRHPRAWLVRGMAAVLLAGTLSTGTGGTPAGAAATFNYAEALQKSIFFYEAQQSGRLPAFNRVEWRGDATLRDGSDVGLDLSGGWYDAGDHVKFGFPMAFATTMLAWGVVQNRPGYAGSGQLTAMLDNLRWATDYLIAAHPSPDVLYVQVGDGSVDHAYWGPPEVLDIKGMRRPAYKIDRTCRGTDVAAETAAAMAAASLVFRPTDPAYADTLLTHARQLFRLADETKGTDGRDTAYVNCVTAARGFYDSTWEGGGANPGATKVYWDELAWASVWLHRASGEAGFLARAREFYPKMGTEPEPGTGAPVPVYSFGLGWNDKQYGVYALMAALTGEPRFHADTRRYLDFWTVGVNGRKGTTTPGGLAFIFFWASLRMAANTAWVALVYADQLGTGDPLYARYHDFAKRQVDYALGANPGNHSYLVGFGTNPPRRVHHRAAHGSWLGYMTPEPVDNRHIIYGALAGGPDAADRWVDDRNDFQRNEVAVDFNAGITAALARLSAEYGGTPLAGFPAPETRDGEIVAEAGSLYTGPDGSQISLFITNRSGWPPRIMTTARARYYFTLDGATTASQIRVSTNDAAGCRATGPHPHAGGVFYAEVDCTGIAIYPGDAQLYRRNTVLRLASTGTWDASNDWSFAGIGSAGWAGVQTTRIEVFDNGVRQWGTAP